MSLNQRVTAEFSTCTPSAPPTADLSIQTSASQTRRPSYLWVATCRTPVGCQAGVPSSHWLSVICSMRVPS